MAVVSRRDVASAAVLLVVLAAVGVGLSGDGLTQPICPDSDGNNSIGGAEPVVGVVSGRSLCDGEEDWFKVATSAGDVVAVDLFIDGGVDLDLSLHTASGSELAISQTIDATESVRYTSPAAGDVFIKVFESAAVSGAYDLAASAGTPTPCGEADDASEPNDTRLGATPLGPTARPGFLCDAPDVFSVNVAPATPTLSGTLAIEHDDGDLDLAVYDANGAQLDLADSTTDSEQVSVSTPAAGVYYLEVFGYQGASNAYVIDADGVTDIGRLEGSVSSRRDGPLAGITVELHRTTALGAVATATTDSNGEYGFDYLAQPGDAAYKVRFVDEAGAVEYVEEWFDSATDHGAALPVDVPEWGTPATADAQLIPVIPDATFTDMPGNQAFWDAIAWITYMEVATGFPDNTFRGADTVNRQQSAFWMWHLVDSPTGAPPTSFTDVPPSSPFRPAIDWVVAEGIISGFPDNTFRGQNDAQRRNVVSWLYSLAGSPSVTGVPGHGFSDVPQGASYENALRWASDLGIVSGFPDGTFRPATTINRQQTALWFFNLAQVESAWDLVDPVPTTVMF